MNRIFNEAQISKSVSLRRNDVYFVSRDIVDEIYKNLYLYSYGINVIDEIEIDEFLSNLSFQDQNAKKLISEVSNLKTVLDGTQVYTDEFIKLSTAFSQVLIQANTIGVSINDEQFIKILLQLLNKKKEFTHITGAWSQYEHLANWLIDLGGIFNVKDSKIQNEYLELVGYSFKTMSKDMFKGYSWGAYRIWKNRLKELKIENRNLIENFIKQNNSRYGEAYSLYYN